MGSTERIKKTTWGTDDSMKQAGKLRLEQRATDTTGRNILNFKNGNTSTDWKVR